MEWMMVAAVVYQSLWGDDPVHLVYKDKFPTEQACQDQIPDAVQELAEQISKLGGYGKIEVVPKCVQADKPGTPI